MSEQATANKCVLEIVRRDGAHEQQPYALQVVADNGKRWDLVYLPALFEIRNTLEPPPGSEKAPSKEWNMPWRAEGLAVYDSRNQLVAHTGITGNRSMPGEQLERMAAMIADAVNAYSAPEPATAPVRAWMRIFEDGTWEVTHGTWKYRECGPHERKWKVVPLSERTAQPPPADLPIVPWNGGWAIRPTAEAADAFWKYWRENGETHIHGYYESTWGAINQALRATATKAEG